MTSPCIPPYFFLRPLLDPTRAWSGIDWQAYPQSTVEASDVIRHFSEAGAAPLADRLPLLLPTNPVWLGQSEFMQKFGTHQAIFVLPSSALADANAVEACQALRRKGRHCALTVDSAVPIDETLLSAFDHLLIDAGFARNEMPALQLINAHNTGFRLIAGRVQSHEQFAWLTGKHFELLDSAFVKQPDPQTGTDRDMTRLKLLKLLSLVVQDADTREIEEVFREESKLSYNLLRLVNSVAVGAKTRISSFNQAITVLGRRQLQRWLQLLIYASQFGNGKEANPLMLLAASRGRQMELLSASIAAPADQQEFSDAAFMTGIFSLLDVLLHMPIGEILAALPLDDSIAGALRERTGILGEMLGAVIAGESGATNDFAAAAATLDRLGIPPARHAMAQMTALYWASRIDTE